MFSLNTRQVGSSEMQAEPLDILPVHAHKKKICGFMSDDLSIEVWEMEDVTESVDDQKVVRSLHIDGELTHSADDGTRLQE